MSFVHISPQILLTFKKNTNCIQRHINKCAALEVVVTLTSVESEQVTFRCWLSPLDHLSSLNYSRGHFAPPQQLHYLIVSK